MNYNTKNINDYKALDIRLILTDLDDTLLTKNSDINDYTQHIFAECKKHGILIGFATARARKVSEKYANILQPDIQILNNGALTLSNGKVIARELMSAYVIDDMISRLQQHPDIGIITLETEQALYTGCPTPLESYGPDYAHAIYCEYKEPLHQAAYKITLETHNPDAFYQIVNQYPECYGFGYAMANWYCISPRNITKGSATVKLAQFLNLQPSQIAAFGDDISDIDMLKFCHYGISMINGLENVKEAAHDITKYDNNHDGVARYISEHFLPESPHL